MGQRGCGKSFLGKRWQSLWPRRVIVDGLFEYTGADGKIVSNFFEFTKELLRLEREKPDGFVLIYQFDPESQVSEQEFNEIVRLCYYLGNLLLVIEEIQDYATAHRLPHWLKKALLTGRHQNLSLLFTTQRPGELHKTILSQCAHVFCGKITEGNDLRYLSNYFRDETDRLALLPVRRFLYLHDGKISEIGNDEI
jgi:DNA helicase HerA-like ATPase